MRKLFFVVLWIALSSGSVKAIDLTIRDPVISDFEITVDASLSATSNYYIQGTLRSQSSSKYFGETKNNKGDWIDYISTPEKEYITSNFFVTDVKNATWSGQLKLRFKIDDPNYLGPGIYDLKIRRFTGSSTSSAGESNTLAINLNVKIPTPTPSPSPSLSPSPTQIPSPSPTPVPPTFPSPVGAGSSRPSPTILVSTEEGTVAGVATEINLSGFGISPMPSPVGVDHRVDPQKPSLNRTRAKTATLIGIGLTLMSLAGFFGYRKYLATISK